MFSGHRPGLLVTASPTISTPTTINTTQSVRAQLHWRLVAPFGGIARRRRNVKTPEATAQRVLGDGRRGFEGFRAIAPECPIRSARASAERQIWRVRRSRCDLDSQESGEC